MRCNIATLFVIIAFLNMALAVKRSNVFSDRSGTHFRAGLNQRDTLYYSKEARYKLWDWLKMKAKIEARYGRCFGAELIGNVMIRKQKKVVEEYEKALDKLKTREKAKAPNGLTPTQDSAVTPVAPEKAKASFLAPVEEATKILSYPEKAYKT
jgi:hypothetical protein